MGAYRSADATVPAHRAFAVVPSDATIIPVTRGLYIAVTGNVTVRMADYLNDPQAAYDNVLFSNVPVGVLPIQVDKVYSTGTSATGIVALA